MRGKILNPQKSGSSDDFQTPEEALDILVPFMKYSGDPKVWECASGKGNLVEGFKKRGFIVVASDIRNGIDFLKDECPDKDDYDFIVTNPPYSLKDKFIEKCFEIGKPFALLMPLTALESEKRQRFYRNIGLQVIIPNKRYNFETPSGKGSSSWFATAWFTWGLNLPQDLNFVDVKTANVQNTSEGKNEK